MNTALVPARSQTAPRPAPARRSLEKLLAPLDRLARQSSHFLGQSVGSFESDGHLHTMPRYVFLGEGSDPIRIGLFAGIHGDEPEGVHALVDFLRLLAAHPERAAGYCLYVYPVNNPTGFEDRTRESREGHDLNREFWRNSAPPEVRFLEEDPAAHAFHGIVSLHTDDTSHGVYGFANSVTLARNLLEPALDAASRVLPRNDRSVIDGFPARDGIIRAGYEGVLRAPSRQRPRPFEIILETPKAAPEFAKQGALILAVQSILDQYRQFIAYASNL
jgi:murein peptide amidase A